MSEAPALSIEGVWKNFDRQAVRSTTLKQILLRRRRRERFWALSDINLTLKAGETIGLIGPNGAGKSTLLRLAAGLGKPTRGRIRRTCKPQAILALGDTFDPLLTGRENAISAAIIAGLTRKETHRKLDEIVSFSELQDFIDQPLRMYSSGMQLRLAFSVAASIEPELLIIDEVLSVGDLRFQAKCFDKLREFQQQGVTILLASHDEEQLRQMCSRVLWLSRGRLQADGEAEEVYAAYRQAMQQETARRLDIFPRALRTRPEGQRANERVAGTLEVEIVEVNVVPDEFTERGPDGGPPLSVDVVLQPHTVVHEPIVGVTLHRLGDGLKVLDVSSAGDGVQLGPLDRQTRVRLSFEHLDLEPGAYYFDVGVYERDWSYVYDYRWQAHELRVGSGGGGSFGPARRWYYG